jgi:hypothetical protein
MRVLNISMGVFNKRYRTERFHDNGVFRTQFS